MASVSKVLELVLSGRSDANIRFSAIQSLLRSMGFSERCKGGHFIYCREGIVEIVNIQPASGGKAKAYQVKQIRGIITDYGLGL